MQAEQVVIAKWVQGVMDAKGWNAAELGRAARVDATTISRAADPGFKSVTSVKTLASIAAGADVPSILDFLSAGAEGATGSGLPSEETLAGLLAAVLPLVPKGRTTAQSMRVVAAALRHGLELLGDQGASQDNAVSLGVAARGAVSRLRDLLPE